MLVHRPRINLIVKINFITAVTKHSLPYRIAQTLVQVIEQQKSSRPLYHSPFYLIRTLQRVSTLTYYYSLSAEKNHRSKPNLSRLFIYFSQTGRMLHGHSVTLWSVESTSKGRLYFIIARMPYHISVLEFQANLLRQVFLSHDRPVTRITFTGEGNQLNYLYRPFLPSLVQQYTHLSSMKFLTCASFKSTTFFLAIKICSRLYVDLIFIHFLQQDQDRNILSIYYCPNKMCTRSPAVYF